MMSEPATDSPTYSTPAHPSAAADPSPAVPVADPPSVSAEAGSAAPSALDPNPDPQRPSGAQTPRRCLVTGANGFVGSWLVDRLVKTGHQVRIICRGSSDLKWLAPLDGHYERLSGDLTEPDSLAQAVEKCEWVFHVGGLTSAPTEARYNLVNAEGTGNVMAAAQRTATDTLERFIYVSSIAAAGPAKSLAEPKTEAMSTAPVSRYGRSKLGGEVRLKEIAARDTTRSWPWVILRPPAVYGPRDKDVFEFFKMIQRGLGPLGIRVRFGWPPNYSSVIHVFDLAEACHAAALAPAETVVGETFFVANPQPYALSEIMREMQRALNKSAVIPVYVPVWVLKLLGATAWGLSRMFGFKPPITYEKAAEIAPRYWVCDVSKAKRQFGWQARIEIPDGFRSTVEWYREQGWL